MALKSSIVSYPERGTYGNNKYRGNCSGRLIKDIIETTTWKNVIYSLLEEYGNMSLKQLYEAVKTYYPVKSSSNNFIKEKVRQVVRSNCFRQVGNSMYSIA